MAGYKGAFIWPEYSKPKPDPSPKFLTRSSLVMGRVPSSFESWVKRKEFKEINYKGKKWVNKYWMCYIYSYINTDRQGVSLEIVSLSSLPGVDFLNQLATNAETSNRYTSPLSPKVNGMHRDLTMQSLCRGAKLKKIIIIWLTGYFPDNSQIFSSDETRKH